MKTLKFLTIAMAAALLPLTACDDKEETPEAVLEEISVDGGAMTFYAEGGRQRVTLTSEEDWNATCPDWISLSPTSGEAGKTEVVISVDSNYEGQNPGPYRYGIVTFAGSETGSTASVTVSQEGIETVSALNLEAVNDGAEVYLPNLVVTSLFNGGFVALYTEESVEENDGDNAEPSAKSIQPCAEAVTTNVMVFTEEEIELGDEISLTAIKSSMSGVPVLSLYTYSVLSTGNEVGETEATDISDVIDSYDFSQWELVKVRVIISEDNSISPVKGNKMVEVAGAAEDVNLEMPNHLVYLIGYYVSTASSTIELYVTEVESVGLIEEKILFSEDFDWLEPWFVDNDIIENTQDSVADHTDHGANRIDRSSKIYYNGMTPLAYMIDSLNYELYQNNNGVIEKMTTSPSYCALWANPDPYYYRWGSSSYKMYVVSPIFSVEGETLSVRLTFDMANKSNMDNLTFRFDILPPGDVSADMETTYTYIVDGADYGENWVWHSNSADLTDVDFSNGVRLGYGNGIWYGDSLSNTVFVDNIKVTWTGAVAE